MPQSVELDQLAAALSEAQGELKDAIEDSANPHYHSRFASLASVWAAARPVLAKHGLAVAQLPEPCGAGELLLTTVLLHRSGQWISGTARLSLARDDAQGYGSAMSYARRYSLAAIVGIATRSDDDDGEAASGEPEATRASGSRPPARDTRAVGGPGVPAAVPAPKSAAVTPGAGDRGQSEYRAAADAYGQLRREHFGEVPPELARAINAVVADREAPLAAKLFSTAELVKATRSLAEHAAACPGGNDCALLGLAYDLRDGDGIRP